MIKFEIPTLSFVGYPDLEFNSLIFLSLGNVKESLNMVTPAMQLASKIPDVHVQLWASSILKVRRGEEVCDIIKGLHF